MDPGNLRDRSRVDVAISISWWSWFITWLRRLLARLLHILNELLGGWDRLSFTMQHQQQTQWCWAAVSTSVSHFYNPASTSTQCDVVNAELGQTTCCHDGSTSACNQPWYLDAALTRTGNLKSWAGGSVPFSTVDHEIDALRPLGVRIGWSGGGGHFVILAGYLEGATNYIGVEDPWYGSSDVAYDTFLTSYQGTGSWTHTYYTEA